MPWLLSCEEREFDGNRHCQPASNLVGEAVSRVPLGTLMYGVGKPPESNAQQIRQVILGASLCFSWKAYDGCFKLLTERARFCELTFCSDTARHSLCSENLIWTRNLRHTRPCFWRTRAKRKIIAFCYCRLYFIFIFVPIRSLRLIRLQNAPSYNENGAEQNV